MALTQEEVTHVARLARMRLSPEETEHMRAQLSAILDSIKLLQEVDIEGVEPTSQVTGLTTVMRSDDVSGTLTREEALANAADQHDGMFRVRAVFEE